MKRVELRTAYHWFCESCGADNFTLPQKAELTDEDAELAYRRFNECDPWMELPSDWRQFEMVHLLTWLCVAIAKSHF